MVYNGPLNYEVIRSSVEFLSFIAGRLKNNPEIKIKICWRLGFYVSILL